MSFGSNCGPTLEAMLVLGTGTPSSSQETWMPAADVELVVDHVGAGRVVGDHGQAVGIVGAGSLRDLLAADHAGGGGRLGVHGASLIGDLDRFLMGGKAK